MIYTVSYCAFLAFLWCLAPFSPKIRRGLVRRLGLPKRIRCIELQSPYWFHVASAGELEQAIPIMEKVEGPVFLTYFSPSADKALELEEKRRKSSGKKIPWDVAEVSPFDFKFCIRPLVRKFRPRALILIHREMWPNLLSVCHEEEVPCLLFASFIPKQTAKRAKFLRSLFMKLSFVGTIDDDTVGIIQGVAPSVTTKRLGDSRVERVVERRKSAEDFPWFEFLGKKVFIWASLWPEDIHAILPSAKWLMAEHPEWRMIFVPHEIGSGSLERARRMLGSVEIRPRLFHHFLQSPDDTSPLLVDRVGILAELYRVATLCFVGGSFRKKVHNVLEPAVYGVPILTGPQVWNSAEAIEMSSKGLWACENSSHLLEKVKELVNSPETRDRNTGELLKFIEQKSGASRKYADVLNRF